MRQDPVTKFLQEVSGNSHYYYLINQYDQIKEHRFSIRSLFPFVITVEGYFEEIEGLETWCKKKFGSRHGTGAKFWWSDPTTKIAELIRSYNLDDHPMLDTADTDEYAEYTSGSWTSFWVIHGGASYFFCDFCFKNSDDAVFFKLTRNF
jgi:hypothetical protein